MRSDELPRPSEDAARKAIEAWLDKEAPGYPTYSMCTDGDDCWAFWIVDSDTTSYLHPNLRIEWYGTMWPDLYEYDGDFGVWIERAQAQPQKDCNQ